jgi:hypothetical protein
MLGTLGAPVITRQHFVKELPMRSLWCLLGMLMLVPFVGCQTKTNQPTSARPETIRPTAPKTEPVAPPGALPAAPRRSLDDLARACPPQPEMKAIAWAGNPVTWLLTQGTLTNDEETAEAEAAEKRLLAREGVTAQSPPEAAQEVFAKLVNALPDAKKDMYAHKLQVLDAKDAPAIAFSVGGGRVYITRKLLEVLPDRNALAFVLGREVGHNVLLHCRCGFQLVRVRDEIRNGIRLNVNDKLLAEALQTTPRCGVVS